MEVGKKGDDEKKKKATTTSCRVSTDEERKLKGNDRSVEG